MALLQKKYDYALTHLLRDTRTLGPRLYDFFSDSDNAAIIYVCLIASIYASPKGMYFADLITLVGFLYWLWLRKCSRAMTFRMPASAPFKDPKEKAGKPSGIMFLGNSVQLNNEEVWFSNNDARTHILYFGTTGSGKTVGLTSIASNALTWGSGFIYVDGKADTDLWSAITAMVRRMGRDDDLLVLNYMTGNSDDPAPSNTLNPFASGSASYLTNMLVSLMPAAEGDNAMWKERAVSLLSSIMPALTWKRDHQEMAVSINIIRQVLNFPEIIKLSRDESLPTKIREGVRGYLDTLPGYVDAAFDDNGMEKPLGPDQPMVDTNVVKQQHGYLTMQFTRSLQSLGNDYGYIFEAPYADIDMLDVVLNRRILIVLIPALEKSGDETANLGKIIAATLKGMMGSTLGSTVEGESAAVIENKPTRSATPFITVFDEVGYYTTEGMGVMAAQARSLGFCLVYAAQDMGALEKRVKEEARSITGNCNIKIFGKLEDPMGTADFFDKAVGKALVTEVSNFALPNAGSMTGSYHGALQAGTQIRGRSSYDELRGFKEGDAIVCFGPAVNRVRIYYANPGSAKAMRVQRFVGLPKTDDFVLRHLKDIAALRDNLMKRDWNAQKAQPPAAQAPELAALLKTIKDAERKKLDPLKVAGVGVIGVQALNGQVANDTIETDAAVEARKASAKQEPKQPVKSSAEIEKVSWTELLQKNAGHVTADDLNADDDEDAREEDEEEGEASGSGSGSSRVKPSTIADVETVKLEQYSAIEAVETKARTGITLMPEGLSDEVKSILKSAADTLSAGLFGTPTITSAPTPDPTVQVQPTSPMKR